MTNKSRNKILLLTGGDEKYHDNDAMAKIIIDFLSKAGFEITLTKDHEMCKWYNIRDFDAILNMTTTRYLIDESEKGLIDSVIGHPWGNTCTPKGFVGIHGACFTYLNSRKYLNMIGGQLLTHPAIQNHKFTVEDKSHPIMQGVEDFELTSELYLIEENTPFQTLLSCEYLGFKRPVVWCKPYGQGRVAICTIGHNVDEVKNEQFKKIITNAVKWSIYTGNAKFPYL